MGVDRPHRTHDSISLSGILIKLHLYVGILKREYHDRIDQLYTVTFIYSEIIFYPQALNVWYIEIPTTKFI